MNDEVRTDAAGLARVGAALGAARRVLVISGAGISAESGIPTFRSEGGWWKGENPEELATLASFKSRPEKIWEWYDYRRQLVARAEPNAAHRAVADWRRPSRDIFIITQNVDDLHERAGSREVVHIHGSIWRLKCLKEGGPVWEDRRVPLPKLPPDCPCGGIARPDVVWFDEALPRDARKRIKDYFTAGRIDVAFVVGTEATFDYVRGYAARARALGALVVEVNPVRTQLSGKVDVRLTGRAGNILSILT
jgi:NAD-dependent protein deacetylase/lipoamidase